MPSTSHDSIAPSSTPLNGYLVSTSGFYAWCHREPSDGEFRRRALAAKIKASHEASHETYGSPRVTRELRTNGEAVSRKTVAKIMRQEGIVARKKRRFKATTDSRHTKQIADNLLERSFTADAPDRIWVTDVTAIWTLVGWVFLAAIIDLYSRRVVGFALSANNDTKLALSALDRAVELRNPAPGLIHHSDRGSPYGSDDYVKRTAGLGMRRSMSRKGGCWDNAVAESFFSTFEFECRSLHNFCGLDHAQEVVATYIDGFYNPKRLHSTNEYISPIEFEIASALQEIEA
jgi:transposase InsO family protein